MLTSTTPATRILRFRDTDYAIPADMTAEQAREELRGRYPEVANAEATERVERRDGTEVTVMEFIPRAGVKGAGRAGALPGRGQAC